MSSTLIRDQDLPALFCAADQASGSAQRWHAILTALNLGFLTAGAFMDVISTHIAHKRAAGITSAICFLAAALLTVLGAVLGLEKKWYSARAVAESTKTVAWKFMIGADPYKAVVGGPAPEQRMVDDLQAILHEFQEVGGVLGGQHALQDQITSAMKSVRAASFSERKEVYLNQRVTQQRGWYSRQSGNKKARSTAATTITVIAQFGAVIVAGMSILDEQINFAPVLAAIAAALIAWGQLRQYNQLAQSYGVAAQELGFALEKGRTIADEGSFLEFVVNSENAISREHIAWRARRVG